jgi:hypothetical protein
MINRMKEIIEHLTLVRNVDDGQPLFHDRRYVAHELDVKNFAKLGVCDGRICFLDAGNAEIVGTDDFSLNLVKLYFNVFDANQRVHLNVLQKAEFYALIYTATEGGILQYKTRLVPIRGDVLPDEKDLQFSMYDETLRDGVFSATIQKIANTVRRFAEWKFSKYAVANLREGDVFVRDGSLQTGVTNEKKYCDELYEMAKKKAITVGAIPKTSSLFTSTGKNLISVVNKMSASCFPEKKWMYYPVVDIQHPDHRAELVIAKLHEQAKKAFRIEIFNEQFNEHRRVLGALAANSKDARFLGYPYGMIDAHTFAKVTPQELEQHRVMFRINSSIDNERVHDVLDGI